LSVIIITKLTALKSLAEDSAEDQTAGQWFQKPKTPRCTKQRTLLISHQVVQQPIIRRVQRRSHASFMDRRITIS